MLCRRTAYTIGMSILVFAVLLSMPVFAVVVTYRVTENSLHIKGVDTTFISYYNAD